jgi:deferrochelatase/peroxidase EfeB/predicted acylesterase/phospholipase RssA
MSATWSDAGSGEPPQHRDATHDTRREASVPSLKAGEATRIQRFALDGYDTEHAQHLLLRIVDAAEARWFIAELLARDLLTRGGSRSLPSIDLGFTFDGLRTIGVAEQHLQVLATKSPAFAEGPAPRAARHLADVGPSAAEAWEKPFIAGRTHVWIAIHADREEDRAARVAELRRLKSRPDAVAFEGWDSDGLCADQLPSPRQAGDPPIRNVHFGFRDSITRPYVDRPERPAAATAKAGGAKSVSGKPSRHPSERHAAGELLLGYENDAGFSYWSGEGVPDETVTFLHRGSFGILRKIEQHEDALDTYLKQEVARLSRTYGFVTPEYLKAKMCGRWPNGALVEPGQTMAPTGAQLKVEAVRDPAADPRGEGCPFGAHIRRASPGKDPVVPARRRTLFRRGVPYGRVFANDGTKEDRQAKRGLMGVFFCASIEDQFETLVSEWLEKNPMGPPNPGRAKDPFVGQHCEPDVSLRIPLPGNDAITLAPFTRFVTTRGTLYALFPSRDALAEIAQPPRELSGHARTRDAAPEPIASKGHALGALKPTDVPPDRFCDIVMEGGVTSGIIYANAIRELAGHYRFKNIGGSSIGSFAAAVTAAAELGRRNGSNAGFDAVAGLPAMLQVTDDRSRTLLERLFQPQPGSKRLFAIFLAALNHDNAGQTVRAGFAEARRQYKWLELCAAVAALAFGLIWLATWTLAAAPPPPGTAGVLGGLAVLVLWTIGLAATLFAAVLVALVGGIVWDVVRGLVPNGFGLCRGWEAGGEANVDPPDLTGFLHAAIQQAAGRKPDEAPLTFDDLWNAPGSPAEVMHFPVHGVAVRSINLEVYASNLAHGRPYRFPLDTRDQKPPVDEDMGRLFFKPQQLKDYFPGKLVDYMVAVSTPYAPADPDDPLPGVDTMGFYELPSARLPVVVAVRLAMSFPLLISAVPLWAIDHEPRDPKLRKLRTCWMSDGGLCSNFPIHLFDSWMPRWPTFGISLRPRSAVHPDPVWLPETHMEGRHDTWNRGLETSSPLTRLGRFLVAIWLAAWRWNDSTMVRMPGVRDRVVRVYLEPDEGGVNIRMPPERIARLAGYGTSAAAAFVKKFSEPSSRGWDEHRWVRFNSLMNSLRDCIDGFGKAATSDRHATPMADQITAAMREAPLQSNPAESGYFNGQGPRPSEVKLTPIQGVQLGMLLRALEDVEGQFDLANGADPFIPIPRPRLRSRHPT